MELFVSGAGGFLGNHVVTCALERGHTVRAQVRPANDGSKLPWASGAGVRLERLDLRHRRGLADALRGCDAVLHLAATKSGDLYDQLGGTVLGTENLLAAMEQSRVQRIIAVSSFAVYDYRRIPVLSVLDELSPLEAHPEDRDEYTQTKLLQERMIQTYAQERGWPWTILRPGVVYGRNNLWTSRLGVQLSSTLWVRTGAFARVPLTYVENCAEAIVMAAESPNAVGKVFNVVDDEAPTQRAYARMLQELQPGARIVPVPGIRWVARAAAIVNRLAFDGRAKLPGMIVPAKIDAMVKPLRFSNQRLRENVGWAPRYPLADALRRSV
jgi:nucleoside-diphosphate-sugar epimerase